MRPAGPILLNYHSLTSSPSPTSTDPSWFAETVARLVDAGFVGIDLPRWLAAGRPRVDRGFAITFDDGLRSILDGVSILERLHIPATVFLVTNFVGKDNDWPGQPPRVPREPTLGWDEVEELSRRGFGFGSHTATHPRLDRLRPEAIGRELQASRDAIEAGTGRPCRCLAYPYGRSSRLVERSASTHFDAGLGTRQAVASGDDHDFGLPRVDACYLRSPRVLDRLIRGELDVWLAARRRLRALRGMAASLRLAA